MRHSSRRQFLKTASAGLAGTFAAPAILSARSPNETVRIAAAGVGGKGWTDVNGAAPLGQVVAFCDVDTGKNRRGGYGAAAEKWQRANGYTDFRQMLDKEGDSIDALTVSTPDHMHAPITMTALQRGIAVYTQKPLTRTVYEARRLTEAAAEAGVSTQMGNQHHSGKGYRTLVKIVQQGFLGKIREAHTWSNRPIWPQGIDRPQGSNEIPSTLHWDLWLGVAPERPYKKDTYHPFKWRGWFDFGAGALGDMGCHIIDPVVWSLELGPASGVSYEGPTPNAETFPKSEVLTYRFPGTKYTATDDFRMKWYDGGKKPSAEGAHVPDDGLLPNQGVLLIGEEGSLVCQHGKQPLLYPQEKFADADLPQEDGLNHYGVWIDGVKSGKAPNSSFAYAGPLTETVLLGVIASRVGAGEEFLWDSDHLRFTNSEAANHYVKPEYRDGWQIKGLS
jgi:predicted dehydrogenase